MTCAVEGALGVGTVGVSVTVVRKMFVLGTDLMREAFVNICSNMLQCRSYKPDGSSVELLIMAVASV